MKRVNLEQFFLRSPNAYMVIDRQFDYIAANDAYLRVTATRHEDLLGKNVFELFPNDPSDPNNESALMLRRSFERVLETGKADVLALLPYRVPTALEDGSVELRERYWSATHTPILNDEGKVTFIFQHTVDITELHRLREEHERAASHPEDALEADVLRRAKALQELNFELDRERGRLLELFQQAPIFMTATYGPEHTFGIANEAYLQLVGHRALLGRTVREAIPEAEEQGFLALLDRVYQTGEPFIGRDVHIQLQHAPGDPWVHRYVDFVYQPLRDGAGAINGIFITGHDVTDKQLAQQALRELNEELEKRVEERTRELTELNRELESFSYSVSHDLRAPLRHIAGFAQLLTRRTQGRLDETSEEYLKTIADAAAEGGKLVDDLLALSRTGRTELQRVEVSLADVLADVQAELAPDVEGRVIHWHVGELPEVYADPSLLRAVMKNLLANATKYTRTRPEAVIEVGARADGGETHVWVRDNGVGFDMRYLDKLFGVFQRLHSEAEFEGTGIGLANVRRIVMRHGGTVWAEGRVDEGATFHFALPSR